MQSVRIYRCSEENFSMFNVVVLCHNVVNLCNYVTVLRELMEGWLKIVYLVCMSNTSDTVVECMMYGFSRNIVVYRSSVTPSQLHIWIAKCAPTWCSDIEIIPWDTSEVVLTVEVVPIEVWGGTLVVPPRSLLLLSTVTSPLVIVSVMSGERHTI